MGASKTEGSRPSAAPTAETSTLGRSTVGYSARGRWDGGERNPPVERLREILQELDIKTEDFEHSDVSLKHETEWCLSAFPSGLLIWENVGCAPADDDSDFEG